VTLKTPDGLIEKYLTTFCPGLVALPAPLISIFMHEVAAGRLALFGPTELADTVCANTLVASHGGSPDVPEEPDEPGAALAGGKNIYAAFEPGVTTIGPAAADARANALAAARIHCLKFFIWSFLLHLSADAITSNGRHLVASGQGGPLPHHVVCGK
jgi:hypothetical protein